MAAVRKGIRPGTLNIPGMPDWEKLQKYAISVLEEESKRIRSLRDRLWTGIKAQLRQYCSKRVVIIRLPNNLNICFQA
jgi:cysteine desulfurase